MWSRLKKTGDFLSSVVVSGGRMLYSMGQTYFGQKHAGQYFFKQANHPASTAFAVLGMLGDFLIQLTNKTPTIWRMMGPNRMPQPERERPATTWGNRVYQTLLALSTVNGSFYLLLAYFGAQTLGELIAELFDEDAKDKDLDNIVLQIAALTVLFSAYRSYRNINHFYFKQTARRIIGSIERNEYEIDKLALTKTLSISLLNVLATPALTTFWVSSAIKKIPYANKMGDEVEDVFLVFAAVSGFVYASLSTVPTVYDYFAKPPHPNYHHSRLSHAICYISTVAGAIDSSNASIFMLVSMVEFTGTDDFKPYGSALIFAIPCALSAWATYAIATVHSGHLDTLNDIKLRQDAEMLPLLRDVDTHYSAINSSNASNTSNTLIAYDEIYRRDSILLVKEEDKLEKISIFSNDVQSSPHSSFSNGSTSSASVLFFKSNSCDNFLQQKKKNISSKQSHQEEPEDIISRSY